MVDLGTALTNPKRKRCGNRAENSVKDIDDNILADKYTSSKVSSCDSPEPCYWGAENKERNEDSNINEADETEENPINNEDTFSEASPGLGPLLFGNIAREVDLFFDPVLLCLCGSSS
jgi:hypothetical protein